VKQVLLPNAVKNAGVLQCGRKEWECWRRLLLLLLLLLRSSTEDEAP
jgi:hypothetical protein